VARQECHPPGGLVHFLKLRITSDSLLTIGGIATWGIGSACFSMGMQAIYQSRLPLMLCGMLLT